MLISQIYQNLNQFKLLRNEHLQRYKSQKQQSDKTTNNINLKKQFYQMNFLFKREKEKKRKIVQETIIQEEKQTSSSSEKQNMPLRLRKVQKEGRALVIYRKKSRKSVSTSENIFYESPRSHIFIEIKKCDLNISGQGSVFHFPVFITSKKIMKSINISSQTHLILHKSTNIQPLIPFQISQ
ncbi:unnamed protein product [Paramecium primaurelia]|uniref:Uncharacterized protein n=1 Tax=Paramecium primaurelia TaxID=5886 RepID=A0A8S1PGA4_PARPR|nr:unnamed protein product [Paramecium primaurelia]